MVFIETIDDILSLEGSLPVVQVANKLDFLGKDAGKLGDDAKAMECRRLAAERYLEVGMLVEAAYSYDRAGKHAQHLRNQLIRYEMRSKSTVLFEILGMYEDAGYAALHTAEALVRLDKIKKAPETPELYSMKARAFFKLAGTEPNTRFMKAQKRILEEYLGQTTR